MGKKDKKTKKSSSGTYPRKGGWFSRLFRTGSSQLADDVDAARAADVEAIVSPTRQIVNNFLSRKLAMGALILLIAMFAVMFIGPLFMPKYKDNYTDVTQQNISPTMSLMKVPSELKNDIKYIDGFSNFTVGVSNAGKLYVWGSTQLGTTGVDVGVIPEEVQNAKIAYASAGSDHIVAIGEDGKIYTWGAWRLGQIYTESEYLEKAKEKNPDPNIAYLPQELRDNGVDVEHVKKLTCGYQATCILMDDGSYYMWGNKKAYSNMELIMSVPQIDDVVFTLNYILALNGRHTTIYSGSRDNFQQMKSNVNAKAVATGDYLKGRTIVSLAATNKNVAALLSDGSVAFSGDFTLDSTPAPTLSDGESYVQIVGGSYHYTAITNKGNVYSWGQNELDQTDMPKSTAGTAKIFCGANQTYAVGEDNALVTSWGLKGYLFGTDTRGANIFQRIIQGGKMTMTIGAVAVIISSIIGIIIGCLSGYFGGKTDILLMRLAEIVGAIPFLPFAMILSAIMGHMSISETMRIFIIMCILGVLSWPGLARLVRGQVLLARESEYVTAAKAMGVKEYVIAFKHILPNIMSVILVSLMLDFGTCMLTESSLSYLGFGVAYPRPTWGNMLNGANNSTIINAYWWEWLFTALFLAVTTICINIVGDALRDVMDPKSSAEK